MNQEVINERDRDIKKVSSLGIFFNLFLLIIKAIVGFASNSQAMIADSLNSAGDIFASIMSYIGAKVSSKPKDSDHPYGHGKAEYIFSFVISLSMIAASYTMIDSSIKSIVYHQKVIFSIWLLIVCAVTIITKFCLFIYAKIKKEKNDSILIKAAMEDHRNDMFVTCGTIIGIVCSNMGYYFVDGVFGIIIAIWIAFVGLRLLRDSYRVLIDTDIGEKNEKDIIKIVEEFDRVLHVDSIASKPIGNRYIVIIKLSMDGDETLKNAHRICGVIKEDLINEFDYISDVIIHINPHTK